ncbi:MAG: ATP-binding protein [Phycisphaeraceae bacterium]
MLASALYLILAAPLGPDDLPPDEVPADAHQHHAQPASQDHAELHGEATPFFDNLLKVYTPRQVCMFYETPVIWLHVISDFFIGVAYFSIPIALIYFVRKRTDVAFHWMFWMFAAFIVACGTTHLIGVWNIWQPLYRLDGIVKLVTAAISVATAVALWPLIPQALALPSPSQLEQRVQQRTSELAQANAALHTEITARTQAEQDRERLLDSERAARGEAERANRVKDEFLATLSHELRTPLNAILGWSQLLARDMSCSDDAKKGLLAIERNARVQAQLIGDLLDMGRIISGKFKLNVQPVEPQRVIEAAVETVQHAAEAKGIRLTTRVAPDVGLVRGDAGRLQQVMWNLLSNAIRFTPAGGQVTVTLRRAQADHVEIIVTDTGQGIPLAFLPHVFDRFRQADASATRSHGGLGLGLSIVKHIVELHGGTIRADSPGLGQGATFIVALPVGGATPSADDEPDDTALDVRALGRPTVKGAFGEPPLLEGVKVLAVDDQADARALLARVFDDTRAEVVTADSAMEALSWLDTGTFHVLISDIGLPKMDGYALIRAVRQRPATRGGTIPAVALTAFARTEDRRHALTAGYQVHLAKPVEPAALLDAVAQLVQESGGNGSYNVSGDET